MGDRMRECQDDDELERLRQNLHVVEAQFDVDLRGPINAVTSELLMYVPKEVEDDYGLSFSPPGSREERGERLDRRALGHLFDSLRDRD